MRKYTGTLQDNAGNVLGSQPVNVYIAGTTNPAALFDDSGLPSANPLTTQSNGQFAFRVFSGTYDLVDATGNSFVTAVQIYDMANQSEWFVQQPVPRGQSPFFIGQSGQLGDFPGGSPGQLVLQQIGSFEIISNGQVGIYGDTLLKIIAETAYASPFIAMYTSASGFATAMFTTPGANPPSLLLSDGSFDPTVSTCGLKPINSTTLATLGGLLVQGAFSHIGTTAGFFTATPISKPVVSGSRHEPSEGTASPALVSLLSALALLGLINNTTTA